MVSEKKTQTNFDRQVLPPFSIYIIKMGVGNIVQQNETPVRIN